MALSIADEVEEQFELCGVSTPYLQSRALLEYRSYDTYNNDYGIKVDGVSVGACDGSCASALAEYVSGVLASEYPGHIVLVAIHDEGSSDSATVYAALHSVLGARHSKLEWMHRYAYVSVCT